MSRETAITLTWPPEKRTAEFRAARRAFERLRYNNPRHAPTALPAGHKCFDPETQEEIILSHPFMIGSNGALYAKSKTKLLKDGHCSLVNLAETQNGERFVFKDFVEADEKDAKLEFEIGKIFGLAVDFFKTTSDYNAHEENGSTLVLKYAGLNLFDYLYEFHETFTDEVAIDLAVKLSRCLYLMHEAGFAHRDVKPENFAIHNGVARLIDFGSACELNMPPIHGEGTPLYSTPNNSRSLSLAEADVYALLRTLADFLLKKLILSEGNLIQENGFAAPIFARVDLTSGADAFPTSQYPTALQVYATALLVQSGINVHAYDLEREELLPLVSKLNKKVALNKINDHLKKVEAHSNTLDAQLSKEPRKPFAHAGLFATGGNTHAQKSILLKMQETLTMALDLLEKKYDDNKDRLLTVFIDRITSYKTLAIELKEKHPNTGYEIIIQLAEQSLEIARSAQDCLRESQQQHLQPEHVQFSANSV